MASPRRQFDPESTPEQADAAAPEGLALGLPASAHADPAGMVGALAGADVGTRVATVARLQRAGGNASLARLLDHSTTSAPPAAPGPVQVSTRIERHPFRASIRRSPDSAPVAAGPVPVPAARSDAGPGEEHGSELRALFQSLGGGAKSPAAAPAPAGASAAAGPEGSTAPPAAEGPAPASAAESAGPASAPAAGDGAPIRVPDIEIPILAEVGKSDAVSGSFTYSGSIAKGGAAPRGFGVTRSFSSKLTGITITPKAGTFEVAATFEHPITYQVRSGTGPRGQKDIASETDADITKANYPKVHTDLTPNMGDLNGRPPRTQFWAEDLTLRHELVHADDDKANGPGAVTTVKTWLDGQTAANEADVRTHLRKIPGRFADALLAALSTEDGEKHAYGDGAPSYKARADKVKEKGDKGDYK